MASRVPQNEWRFVFAKNKDLPCSTYNQYTEYQRQNLIASLIGVNWPPTGIFRTEPFSLMDELLADGDMNARQANIFIEKTERPKKLKTK